MSKKYKLVPVEPTPEMLEAGADWCGQGLGTYEAKGRAATAYKFMLTAAPEAGQEPAAWARMKDGEVTYAFADRELAEFVAGFAANELVPLYLRPQPAPDVQAEPVGYVSPRLLDALRSGKACGITMEDKPDTHNGVTIPLYTAPKPAPDVAQLVEALERIMTWPDGGRHYGQSKIKVFAAEALAAYRKEGEA